MITTRITVKPHLAEYVRAKFPSEANPDVVHFPDSSDLYHWLYDLMGKRPVNCPRDEGNLEIILPDRRSANCAGGKSPEQYNYIGVRGAEVLSNKINTVMRAELHDFLDENKHSNGVDYKTSVFTFIRRYSIESISEDALLKDYQRWRYKMNRKQKRREYNRRK